MQPSGVLSHMTYWTFSYFNQNFILNKKEFNRLKNFDRQYFEKLMMINFLNTKNHDFLPLQ